MTTPESFRQAQKIDKAIDKVVTVIVSRFNQYFDGEESEEDIEVKENLIELCEKVREVSSDNEEKAVRDLLAALESSQLDWFNWTPRSSELVLHEAGYEQAKVRYADEEV